ncbi:MAG: B12-binding domain-containing radical SAM protein [Promethearchaeota archaeon]|nr:MAG: B12-binding domain-containing radical SAM protein [Candidatus Lokiarchaeota archaeon]
MHNNNSNLLFIIPGFFFIEEYQKLLYYNDIPLGTIQLSSFLKELVKVITNIIDLRVEGEKEKELGVAKPKEDNFKKAFLKILEKNNIQDYNNIGINCYTSFQYFYTDLIAKILRKEFPKVNIIVGGYHPTGVPEDFTYKNSPYDVIIRGEAEMVLLNLLNSNKLNKIEKKKQEPLILSSDILTDINSLPFPDYELYLKRYPLKDKFKFEIYNSRGCPYQCTFCSDNYAFRTYSFEKFQENFEKLTLIVEEYNKKNPKIGFADQSFNRLSFNERILDYLIENEYNKKFVFSCQSRIETVASNIKLIDKFKKSKMIVGYGFETATNLLLREMKKTNKAVKYLEDTQRILKEYKDGSEIYCRLNILVGFPGENQKTFNDTVKFIEKYAIHEDIQISPTFFTNYPNVFVYENMDMYEKKYGTEFLKEWWKLPSNPFKNAVPTKLSHNYSLKELILDYKEKYINILKEFKRQGFAELVTWKRFYNKWYKEL